MMWLGLIHVQPRAQPRHKDTHNLCLVLMTGDVEGGHGVGVAVVVCGLVVDYRGEVAPEGGEEGDGGGVAVHSGGPERVGGAFWRGGWGWGWGWGWGGGGGGGGGWVVEFRWCLS